MPKIFKLDQHTANLIAAGEVIERAASVVKELVENSIDAHAMIINISLIDSGISEIIVKDNGSGMDAYDAKICVEPHATSKIKDGNDLFRIKTLGFRGEALPSIVAISNFKIKTSNDGVKGIMFSLRAGKIVSEATIAFPKGTEVIVKNLFFNTPARLQNLQSPSMELSYIVDYVTKIALSKPNIAFKLSNNDRVLLQTFGTNRLLEVISNTYGDEVAKSMIEIFENDGYFKVSGYVSKTNVSRSSKNHINIIVNGRVIKNNKIINAVYEAYKERLVGGRFPICVINIAVDPSLIDVNIHPAKLEVRFSNEDELLNLIKHAIKYTLSQTDLIVNVEKKIYRPQEWDINDEELDEAIEQEEDKDNSIIPNFEEKDFVSEAEYEAKDTIVDNKKTVDYDHLTQKNKHLDAVKESFEQQRYSMKDEDNKTDPRTPNKLPKLYYVGQLHGTYLLFQDEENFYLVDQHAAYERINYEKIVYELNKEKSISYELLIPIKMNFTPSESILINEKLIELTNLGIIIEDFGSGTYTIRQVPIWFARGKEKEFVEEIIIQVISNKKTNRFDFYEYLAKSIACKKSIKANQFLDKAHIEYLIDDLGRCDNPYSCPHGRPTIVKFATSEIERWFKRIV